MKRPSLISVGVATLFVSLVLAIFLTRYPRRDLQRHDFHSFSEIKALGFVSDTPYDFAGTRLPLDDKDTTSRFTNEMDLLANNLPQLLLYHKRGFQYLPYIKEQLRLNDIPEDFAYIAVAESGLDPEAVSHAGASGIWQFLASTANDFGLNIDEYTDERLELHKSTEAAIEYFKNSYAVFGDWTLVAASFNRGISGMKALLADQEKTSYYDLTMNQETGRYIFRIVSLKYSLQLLDDLYDSTALEQRYKIKTVSLTEIQDVSSWSVHHDYDFNLIKKLNPWILGNSLPEGEWTVIVPSYSKTLFSE